MLLNFSEHLITLLEQEIERRAHGNISNMDARNGVISTAVITEYTPQRNRSESYQPPIVELEKKFWNPKAAKYDSFCAVCYNPIKKGEVVWLTEGSSPRHNTERCAPPEDQRRSR